MGRLCAAPVIQCFFSSNKISGDTKNGENGEFATFLFLNLFLKLFFFVLEGLLLPNSEMAQQSGEKRKMREIIPDEYESLPIAKKQTPIISLFSSVGFAGCLCSVN